MVPLEASHARTLMLADGQAYAAMIRTPAYCESLAAAGPSFTALADGRAIACFGVAVLHVDVGQAWGLVSRDAGPFFCRSPARSCAFSMAASIAACKPPSLAIIQRAIDGRGCSALRSRAGCARTFLMTTQYCTAGFPLP